MSIFTDSSWSLARKNCELFLQLPSGLLWSTFLAVPLHAYTHKQQCAANVFLIVIELYIDVHQDILPTLVRENDFGDVFLGM